MKKIFTLLFIFNLFFCCCSYAQTTSWYKDVTKQTHLFGVEGFRIYAVDVNNDGYPDLVLQNDDSLNLFINEQDPDSSNPRARIFVDRTEASGINSNPDYPSTSKRVTYLAAFADVDNNGTTDIVTGVLYYQYNLINDTCYTAPDPLSRCEVLLNDGNGNFKQKENNGLDALGLMPGSCFSFLDYDRDGNIDLYVGNHYSNFNSCGGYAFGNFLMKGNGDGTFTDVSTQSGVNSSVLPLYGSNVADWNNDCWPDILTSPYLTTGYGNLWKNNGNGTFTDVGDSADLNPHFMTGAGQPMVPWAAMPYDYDNDGDMDLLMVLVHGGNGIGEGRTSIFTNLGQANGYRLVPDLSRIIRVAPQSTSHGDHYGRWFDIDNDGLVDLAITECVYQPATDRIYICKQDTTHIFHDITSDLGLLTIKSPHSMEPIDFDLDGDDDLLVSRWANSDSLVLLRNDIGSQNHWLAVSLVAPQGVNKSAIGARIKVTAGGVTQTRDIYSGEGNYGGQQPFILNFGIGANTMVDTLRVRWPDANCNVTTITNITPNQRVYVSSTGLVSAVTSVSPADNTVSLYPNPVNNVLTVEMNYLPQSGYYYVYNLYGDVVLTGRVNANGQTIINTNNLTAGAYFLRTIDNKIVQVKKFIKQ